MRFQVQRSQQEHQLEPIYLPKYVERRERDVSDSLY